MQLAGRAYLVPAIQRTPFLSPRHLPARHGRSQGREMTGLMATAANAADSAAQKVKDATGSETLANVADKVQGTLQAGQSGPMHGRTAIVTGANSGIGYYSSLSMAKAGGHIILAVRNPQKGEEAAKSINQEAANAGEGGDAEWLHIDLASLRSVHSFAQEFKKRNKPLHVLLNNGGDFSPPDAMTEDGFEYLVGVNVFAHFYLTHLLLDSLKEAAPKARVVFTTSPSESNVTAETLDVDGNLEGVGKSSTVAQYGATKLMNILIMKECQKRFAGSGVEFFAAHPGIAKTGIFSRMEGPDLQKPLSSLLKLAGPIVGQSAEGGAEALIHAATSPELEGKGGDVNHIIGPFYGPGKNLSPEGTSGLITNTGNTEGRPARNSQAFDDDLAARLYDNMARILKHKVKDFDNETFA